MTCSLDEIYTLQVERERFLKRWLLARDESAFLLDYNDLGDDATQDEADDAAEERYHCGVCTVNFVADRLEKQLLPYLLILEKACGLDPEGN